VSKKNRKSCIRRARSKRQVARSERRRVQRRRHTSRPPNRGLDHASIDLHVAYLDAHRLLPPDYPADDENLLVEFVTALRTLENPPASEREILRAIMILAHTPDPRAETALLAYAEAGGVHADMAEIGVAECAMWLQEAEPPSRPLQIGPTMLN